MATGSSANEVARVLFTIQTEASTRAAGKRITSTDRVFSRLKMGRPTLGHSKMIEWSTELFQRKKQPRLQHNSRLKQLKEKKIKRQMEAKRLQRRQEMLVQAVN